MEIWISMDFWAVIMAWPAGQRPGNSKIKILETRKSRVEVCE